MGFNVWYGARGEFTRWPSGLYPDLFLFHPSAFILPPFTLSC